MEHEFTLRFRIPSVEIDVDALVERLYETGCSDALVGIGAPGQLALDFARLGDSATEAVVSAARDVKRAIPRAELIEIRHSSFLLSYVTPTT